MPKIRVLLADAKASALQEFRTLLSSQSAVEFEIAGEVSNGREAVRMAKKCSPDVIVMDLTLPLLNGLEATRRIIKNNPSSKILILSSYSDPEYVQGLTEAGAVGFLLKRTAASELVHAIQEIHARNIYYGKGVTRESHRKKLAEEILNERETEVLGLLADGRTDKQIATRLGISLEQAQEHHRQVIIKLNHRSGIYDHHFVIYKAGPVQIST